MDARRIVGGGLLAAAALGVAGCGGGAITTGGGVLTEHLLTSVPAEDGVVYSDRTLSTTGTLPVVGDLGADRATLSGREFLSFDLSPVPANVLVTSAVLRVDQFVVVGSPYSTLGSVYVDHLDYDTLDANDYGLRALDENLGPLGGGVTLGARSLDVTAQVAFDVARGRSRSQFRLRFSTDHDGDRSNDFVSFAESEASVTGNGQAPVLLLLVRNR